MTHEETDYSPYHVFPGVTLTYTTDHYCPFYSLVHSIQFDHPHLTLPPPYVMTLFEILLYDGVSHTIYPRECTSSTPVPKHKH
jgi:hypothetical protein